MSACKLKILMVCGAGLGSSFACQMATEDVLKELHVDASLDHGEISGVGGARVDIIMAAQNFEKQFQKFNIDPEIELIFLKNLVSKTEIREKLEPVLKEKGVL